MKYRVAAVLVALATLVLFSCGDFIPETPQPPRPDSPWRPGEGPGAGVGGPNIHGLHPWTGAEGTWYQIFPMTFYDGGHRFVGNTTDWHGNRWDEQSAAWGDLRGIIQHLDYLSCRLDCPGCLADRAAGNDCIRSLHVDGIWLTPIMLGTSYHKYDTECFVTVPPPWLDG